MLLQQAGESGSCRCDHAAICGGARAYGGPYQAMVKGLIPSFGPEHHRPNDRYLVASCSRITKQIGAPKKCGGCDRIHGP